MLWRIASIFTVLLLISAAPKSSGNIDLTKLPRYETKYYIIYSDLDRESVHEAAIRVTRIAEVYAQRTRGFSGAIHQKFPFILFKKTEDYHTAGGPEGSAGMYNGRVLIAIAGEKLSDRTWHVVQHEGFHQFAANVIRGDLPTWINEGLAEYFGEGIFTGDDLFTGVIPEWRRKRIVKSINADKFKKVDTMLQISLGEWNREMNVINYDQAWSMVQFLAHGENGKYQPALTRYMNALGNGKGNAEAWKISFGDSTGFEERWKEFWLGLPENPSDDVYRKATVSTLTSFIARAWTQKQRFESMQEFAQAASDNALKSSDEELLPRSILASATEDVKKRLEAGEEFSIEYPTGKNPQPMVVCKTKDGKRVVGKFVIRGARVSAVTIE